MPQQSLPSAASEYGREQRREIGAALAAIERLWSGMSDDFDGSFARIAPSLLEVMDTAQRRVSVSAAAYIPRVLEQTNPAALAALPDYWMAPDALVGTTGSGFSTDSLAYGSVIRAKVAVGNGGTVEDALSSAGKWLGTAAGTLLSDTGRTAEKVAGQSRGVTTWVRMLNPPSCGRCVILAGKETHRQTAFLRHPGCDCRNVPVSEDIAGDLTTNPHAYLDSLDDAALAKSLGSQANAQAFRDGADMNQLVNAYRRSGDVRAAQVYGRRVKYTTEATTKRGRYGKAARAAGRDTSRIPRLMPESIYAIAESPADAQRLLRLYGWLT
jgi:hypothetical protein